MNAIAANALFCGLFPTKTKNLSTAGGFSNGISPRPEWRRRLLVLAKSPQFQAFYPSSLAEGKTSPKKNKKSWTQRKVRSTAILFLFFIYQHTSTFEETNYFYYYYITQDFFSSSFYFIILYICFLRSHILQLESCLLLFHRFGILHLLFSLCTNEILNSIFLGQ